MSEIENIEQKNKITKVSVGVMIWKDDKILLMRRQESIGAGDYALPGGKLDYMESFEDCVRREVLEETGIKIKNIEFVNVSNSKFFDLHFVLLGFQAEWESGEARIMEPDKCDYIGWHDVDSLPEPFFGPSKVIIDAYKNKTKYLDSK